MQKKAKEIIGCNLRLARELADLSQEDFAAKLDISRATLSAIENGHASIDSPRLLRAAQILGRPVADFFKEHEGELILMYRAAEDSVPRAEVRARFQRLCEGYKELEEIVGVADTLLTPPEYSFSSAHHSRALHFATMVAKSERERLGLSLFDPIENIFRLFDENGVRIFLIPIEDQGVSGLSAFSQHKGFCVLLNLSNTVERNIFTLAHEYGHFLMDRALYKNAQPEKAHDDREVEEMANTFAAHFLVPDVGLRDLFAKNVGGKQVTVEDVVFLKKHFRVSFKMMTRRLRDSELVSQQAHNELLDRASKFEPDSRKEPAGLGRDLIDSWQRTCRFYHLAKKAILQEMVSLGKLSELLDKNIVETRNIVQEWRKELLLVPA